MYQLLRPLLFKLDAEKAHHLTLCALHYVPQTCFSKPLAKPIKAMGLEFPHAIGLAAGLDKNGEHLDALAKLGFAFLEIGTVTPRPQAGNPKPRLFRLTEAHALINRMGFNNAGVDMLVNNVKRAGFKGILGINIGKNKETPLEHAALDYVHCMRRVYPYASYITINISSPNTPGLRLLQQKQFFADLLHQLCGAQQRLADELQRWVPLVIKLSPDETDDTLKQMAELMLSHKVAGIIATNTTCRRDRLPTVTQAHETGGLSGKPLATRSTHCLQVLKSIVGDELTLIGVGGIDNPQTASDKLAAGASLLQVYTGLIYEGPGLIARLAEAIAA